MPPKCSAVLLLLEGIFCFCLLLTAGLDDYDLLVEGAVGSVPQPWCDWRSKTVEGG